VSARIDKATYNVAVDRYMARHKELIARPRPMTPAQRIKWAEDHGRALIEFAAEARPE